jgi:hypothetical protein
MVWDGSIFGIKPLGRRVQQAESFGGHPGDYFGGNSTPRPSLADAEEAAGTSH